MAKYTNGYESAEAGTVEQNKEESRLVIANKQKVWDREEVVILVTEYFRTKNLSENLKKKSIENTSEFLRKRERLRSGSEPDDKFRNIAGITMEQN